jgi:hypothetical protein
MDRENEKAPVKKDRGEEDTMCHYIAMMPEL